MALKDSIDTKETSSLSGIISQCTSFDFMPLVTFPSIMLSHMNICVCVCL